VEGKEFTTKHTEGTEGFPSFTDKGAEKARSALIS